MRCCSLSSLRPPHAPSPARSRSATGAHGQSLAEFTLVLPLILLVLLTVADFGRYFAATIAVESAARTAAEIAAAEYLREAQPLDTAGYARIDSYAWQSVCDEIGRLPNAVPAATPGAQCGGVPTLVCVHDGADPDCATVYNVGTGGLPTQCSSLQPAAAPTNAQTGGSETSTYVEVRVCYRFNTFIPMRLPFFGIDLVPIIGDFYVERARAFTVADY